MQRSLNDFELCSSYATKSTEQTKLAATNSALCFVGRATFARTIRARKNKQTNKHANNETKVGSFDFSCLSFRRFFARTFAGRELLVLKYANCRTWHANRRCNSTQLNSTQPDSIQFNPTLFNCIELNSFLFALYFRKSLEFRLTLTFAFTFLAALARRV